MHGRLWTNCAHWQGCPSQAVADNLQDSDDSLLDESVEQPADKAADSSGRQPPRADEGNHSLAPVNLVNRFVSQGGMRRVLNGDASDAASDSLSVPDDSSDTASDTHPQSASGVDTDNEQLETRGIRLFGLRQSVDDGQNNRRAGKRSRPRGRKQGPQRQLIHPGTEGSKLDREPLQPCTRPSREARRTRGEALGDADTESEGREEDESDSSDSLRGFLVKDGGTDDDSDYMDTATTSGETPDSSNLDDANGAPDQNNQLLESVTPIVLSSDASADDGGDEVKVLVQLNQKWPQPVVVTVLPTCM